MALVDTYKAFLRSPSADAFTADASLSYVPTTVTLSQPAAIVKHLKAQSGLLEKKTENLLNVIEGSNALCVETETVLNFIQSGGTYLPGIDDNFVAGKTVTLPIIQGIRLLWDQGCLLKAVDTIGARGRGWPISDGKDQIKLIVSSAASAPASNGEERVGRRASRGKDPHSSLSLFAPPQAPEREESPRHSVAPRASAKPPLREWAELFAGEEPPMSPERSESPSKRKENANPHKAGAGKHFHEPRLFDGTADEVASGKGIKTSDAKYSHFEFGEAAFTPVPVDAAKPKNKHLSQWDFVDFTTPAKKPPPRTNVHHQPSSDWNNEANAKLAEQTPVFRKPVAHARPSSSTNFEFKDEYSPEAVRVASKDSRALYDDNSSKEMPLRKISNPNQHKQTFSSTWDSDSPTANNENANTKPEIKPAKPVERPFDFFSGTSEDQTRGIKIAGDGMGKRKQGEKQWWDLED